MAVIIRIVLYIIAGRLAAGGWLPQDVADVVSSDPEFIGLIEAAVSSAIAGLTVTWWRLAKKNGWAT